MQKTMLIMGISGILAISGCGGEPPVYLQLEDEDTMSESVDVDIELPPNVELSEDAVDSTIRENDEDQLESDDLTNGLNLNEPEDGILNNDP